MVRHIYAIKAALDFYLSDAGLSLKRWTAMTGLMMVWSRLCQPEPPGTPAGVCPCHQSAAGPPRAPALFSLFSLMSKNGKSDYYESDLIIYPNVYVTLTLTPKNSTIIT